MSLQFILGNSGSGKTDRAYRQIVNEAGEHPLTNYLVIVPEQFTMQTQQKLVELAPNHAIMNVDVLSFKRLAYRIFDELGMNHIRVLEETGKNLVLRKVAGELSDQMTTLKGSINRMGYIDEVKSLISELVQYNVTPQVLEDYRSRESVPQEFSRKLADIILIYRGFEQYMKDNYITAEELLHVLIKVADQSALLKDAVLVLDEFTGFTPIQNDLLRKLLPIVDRMQVILTYDKELSVTEEPHQENLFYLTQKTMQSLNRMAEECRVQVLSPVILNEGSSLRFGKRYDLLFLEQNLFRAKNAVYEEVPKHLMVSSFANPKEELLFTAREIRRLVQDEGYRYRDIAVVCASLDSYSSYVEDIYGKYQIPYFLDQTQNIVFHPFIESIRALLQIVEEDFSADSVLRFLRCGFSGIPEEQVDELDNYLTAIGIRGHKGWENRWLRLPKDKESCDLELMNALRQRIYDLLLPLWESFHGKHAAEDQITALYEVLLALETEQQLWQKEADFLEQGKQVKSREYGQIYSIVMSLLEKYYDLLGKEHFSIEEFSEIMDSGMTAASVASIPPGYDSVTIGDIERTRLNHIRILFFIGVNDGLVPKAANAGGIISEYERQMMQDANLALAPGSREQAFIQRFYLYRNLTKPSHSLYLSYARVDGEGKAIRPSYLIHTVSSLFPALKVEETDSLLEEISLATVDAALDYMIHAKHLVYESETCVDGNGEQAAGSKEEVRSDGNNLSDAREMEKDRLEDWLTLTAYLRSKDPEAVQRLLEAGFYTHQDDPISKAVAEAIYGHTMEGSVTRLEKFASCAYAHFLSYGLKLKEREVSGMQNTDIGNIYHMALARYSQKLEASDYDWFHLPDEVRSSLCKEAFTETLQEFPDMTIYATEQNRYLTKRLEGIFEQTVWALTKQVQAGKFVPTAYELSFSELHDADSLRISLEGDHLMQLRGQIDRLDLCPDEDKVYVKIIDYKSGKAEFDLVSVYHGLSLQLVAYTNAAMDFVREQNPQQLAEPGAILYYQIDDPQIEVAENEELSDEDLALQILERLKPNGLVNQDGDVISLLDQDLTESAKSLVIPVKLNRGSIPSKTSSVATTEEFSVIQDYVSNKIAEFGNQIYEGKVTANPFKGAAKTGSCTYCKFDGICGIRSKLPGYEYRTREAMKRNEVIDAMQTQNAIAASRRE